MTDLLEELRDGHVLLSLLEVLLGTTLVSLLIANVSMLVYLFRFCSKKKQTKNHQPSSFTSQTLLMTSSILILFLLPLNLKKGDVNVFYWIVCAIEFVCFTEKSRRSNAWEQAQQCSHGIETAGAKQGRCFEPLKYLLLLLVLSTFTRSILNKKQSMLVNVSWLHSWDRTPLVQYTIFVYLVLQYREYKYGLIPHCT